MVGVAFFLMVMGIFTIALDMLVQSAFDDAIRNAARQVQIWGENGTASSGSQFVTAVCNQFSILAPNCSTKLQYSVQVAPYFGQMTNVTLQSNGSLSSNGLFGTWVSGTFTANTLASTGQSAPEFLLVQAAYPLPFYFLHQANGVVTENGTRSVYAAAAMVVP